MLDFKNLENKKSNGLLKFNELNYEEISSLPKERTLVIISISPTEVHGPHLPVGTDLLIAEHFAVSVGIEFKKLKSDWEVVIYPSIPAGVDTIPLKGSVHVSQRIVRNLLLNVGSALANCGFKYIALFNNHMGPRHVVAIDEACIIISKKYKISMFTPFDAIAQKVYSGELNNELKNITESLSGEFSNDRHAGKWETSALLNLKPELITGEYKYLPTETAPKLENMEKVGQNINSLLRAFRVTNKKREEFLNGWNTLWGIIAWMIYHEEISYIGSPSLASKEYGEALISRFKKFIADYIIDIVEGKKKANETPSPFWNLPFLRTNFFRYLLGLSAASIAGLLYLNSLRKKKN